MKIIIQHPEKIEILKYKKLNYKKIIINLSLFVVYIIFCCFLLHKICLFF